MANTPPEGPPGGPPPMAYGAPPPAGGYGLDQNPYAAPQTGFDLPPVALECPQANTALKYAIIGLFCFGFVLGPLAIKNALDAKKIIALSPGMTGEGKATAALIIGVIDVLFFFVGMLLRVSNR